MVNVREFGPDFAAAFAKDVADSPYLQELIEEGMSGSTFQAIVELDLSKEARGIHGTKLFPNLRGFLRKQIASEAKRLASGMGQWDALVQAIGAATSAAITVTTNKKIADAQKDAAAAQLRQQEIAFEQMKLAQAAQSAAFQPPGSQPRTALDTVSKYALPVGAGAAVLIGGYLLLR